MATRFNGKINIDIRDSEPDCAPFEPPKAPEGAPTSCTSSSTTLAFRDGRLQGPIETPNIDQIAANGVRYTQWHVGRHPGDALTEDYPGAPPHRFTGGTIRLVAVDVTSEPYMDLEREAAMMLARE
jgi:hypothetical protein